MIKWVKFLLGPAAAPATAPLGLLAPAKPDLGRRSGGWPAVRAAHLKREPECQVCGSRHDLDVHHVEPFHLHPDLELEPSNLITLCTPHHLTFGHFGDYKSWNVRCREDVTDWRGRYRNRPYQGVRP